MPLAEQAGLLLSAGWWQVARRGPARTDRTGADVVLVERAVGVLMAQRGCSAEQARAALTEAAGGHAERLREIAGRLLHTVQQPRDTVQQPRG
jgi:hypothetical protein